MTGVKSYDVIAFRVAPAAQRYVDGRATVQAVLSGRAGSGVDRSVHVHVHAGHPVLRLAGRAAAPSHHLPT